MSISVDTVFEVRSTGSDTNGGGFVAGSGTDYSQQDSAQASGTNLAVDATTNTKVTSASHSFVAADVGNLINISAGTGFTTGVYQIVSVSSGAANLDRSPAATSTTGGTWAMGGALATPAQAESLRVSGNTVYLKGSFTLSSALSINKGSASGRWSRWIGYTSTRTDGGRATFKAGADSINLISPGASFTEVELRNILLDGNGHSSINGFFNTSNGGPSNIINCRAINMVTGFQNRQGNVLFLDCSADTCSSYGFARDTGNDYITARCFAYNCGEGFHVGRMAVDCIADSCGTGFEIESPGMVVRCIARNSTTYGFYCTSNSEGTILLNCRSYNSSGTPIHYNHGNAPFGQPTRGVTVADCAAGGTGTVSANIHADNFPGFVTLTGDPDTAPASKNYAPNTTAGAGAAVRGKSIVYADTGTTGYPDIGVQHQDAGGGSTVIVIEDD
jgi:hypothetical protein